MWNNINGIIRNTRNNIYYTSKYINISMSYVILYVNYVLLFNMIIIFILKDKILSNYIHIYIYLDYFIEQEIISSPNAIFLT